MPFLNFTDKPIVLNKSSHARYETQLAIQIEGTELAILKSGLSDLLLSDAPETVELRVDLPSQWTLFWKLREGESRLLLAHPEVDAWVGMVSMTREHCEAVVAAFTRLAAAPEALSQLGVTNRISNFELLISLAGTREVAQ